MRSAPKKYNLTLYKKGRIESDMYRATAGSRRAALSSAAVAALSTIGAIGPDAAAGSASRTHEQLVLCPACRKIQDKYPGDELTLRGVEAENRAEIARILRNEESRAREKNPLERIMRRDAANGGWRIETTTKKLAQRLGRSIKKARGGKLSYKWEHDTNKYVRVVWEKSGGAEAK